jgi:hypothetical protein
LARLLPPLCTPLRKVRQTSRVLPGRGHAQYGGKAKQKADEGVGVLLHQPGLVAARDLRETRERDSGAGVPRYARSTVFAPPPTPRTARCRSRDTAAACSEGAGGGGGRGREERVTIIMLRVSPDMTVLEMDRAMFRYSPVIPTAQMMAQTYEKRRGGRQHAHTPCTR